MSESSQRGNINKILRRGGLDGVAVENSVYPGTPDVNYIEGWIELKWLRAWPRNADESPVLLPHYTQQQRNWGKRRSRVGGNIWLLLQVKREWLLFKGDVAAQFVGKATRLELRAVAFKVWHNGLDAKEFVQWLK